MRRKLLVVEFEGASWRVVRPLMETGALPNLRSLAESGCRGTLVSAEPFHSPAAWTSIWTGKSPGRHGIADTSQSQQDLRAKRLWDVLREEAGCTVGLAGVLLTSPPRHYAGCFAIGDALSVSPESHPCGYEFLHELSGCHLFPRAFLKRLPGMARQALAAGAGWDSIRHAAYCACRFSFPHRPGDGLETLLPSLQARLLTDSFLTLYRRLSPDFADLHLDHTKTVQHLHWRGLARSGLDGPIQDAYRLADRILGRALAEAGGSVSALVLSSHGMADAPEDERQKTRRTLDINAVLRILKAPRGRLWGRCYCDHVLLAQGGSLHELARALAGIHWGGSGRPVLDVRPGADGIRVQLACQPLESERVAVFPGNREVPLQRFLPEVCDTVVHHPEGIFVLSGPGIRKGRDCGSVPALDVAPTLLKLCGLSAPGDWEGRALGEMIEDRG